MESFASRARNEIAQRSLQKDCCVRAAAYGIACFAKYFDAKGLVLQTEQHGTVLTAQELFARCGIQDPLPDLRQCIHWRSFFVQRNGDRPAEGI